MGLSKWCMHLAYSLLCQQMLEMLSVGQLYHVHLLWCDGPVKELALACDALAKGLALGHDDPGKGLASCDGPVKGVSAGV